MTREPSASRLRVLVVSHLYPEDDTSSSGIFVREQVGALAEIADVTLAVGRYGGPAPNRSIPPAGGATLVEVVLPPFGVLPSAAAVARALPVYRDGIVDVARASTRGYDVIHAHYGFPDGVAAVMAGSELSIPTVVTLHGSDYHQQLSRPIVGEFAGRQLARADRIVGVSPLIAEGMRERFGLSEQQVIHLANGYNEKEIHVHADRAPRYFLFVGALIERKNPGVLIDAFASVADRLPYDLVVVGDGPIRDRLAQHVESLGLRDRVHFEGQQAHITLDSYLSKAVALVLPSRREGMPIVVNEALASGTPVIASRLPGTERQVRSAEFGLLVEAGDRDGLANALVAAAETEWDYGAISRDCNVPSWSEYALTLVELYNQVAAEYADTERGPS